MKRVIARLKVVSGVSPNIWGRIKYVWSIFIHFAPVAFALDLVIETYHPDNTKVTMETSQKGIGLIKRW